ncbi:hypothetical protein O6H91_01G162700 [Diphasiastrum complanatum]|uniref:Uncharacterized protein n=6 Tax=Diphasiastrum complanatum TaxID=34168 RepID=A0ACC2EY48_DIPCM|nr:hypothetical protein O6H91_01G162700 [Diphasiastrum complanatum]KAJ7571421.1 hypothetical protein O6H91_01G162700 [Diphasiastrum complanatum]KAJ7571422.1 hypothetical protein O6H91_01G162700 [Diphasiastrum complanatum]KAJ7571424.1 hypothetical protein O6H91_01G162700 [Diphasiastrum complanatum]KAJ7571425.1 hypothetical protein O6H91_01G162700 [Diphasiastrum complanatum]
MHHLSFAPSPALLLFRSSPPSHPWRQLLSFPFTKSGVATRCLASPSSSIGRSNELEEVAREEFKGRVQEDVGRIRLDLWLAREIPYISRGQVQSSIQRGLARVNSQPVSKVSHVVRSGDHIECKFVKIFVTEAVPENIPLDIIYEDKYLIVLNKPAHMVVHPAPGHPSGTLVNALLHHCGLPAVRYPCTSLSNTLIMQGEDNKQDVEEDFDDDEFPVTSDRLSNHSIRPGIVHRLDKGTSGLLVVAKDDYTHMQLCDQFKARRVQRSYISLTCGTPPTAVGRVQVPIGRDPKDRKKMAAIQNIARGKTARFAASRFRILETLAGGGCALVEWKLETGRTHQIRVHAKYIGYPLLGDELYGGTAGTALSRLLPSLQSVNHGPVRKLTEGLQRPCLHALTLGYKHPRTGQDQTFSCPPPADFEGTWIGLRSFGWSKTN